MVLDEENNKQIVVLQTPREIEGALEFNFTKFKARLEKILKGLPDVSKLTDVQKRMIIDEMVKYYPLCVRKYNPDKYQEDAFIIDRVVFKKEDPTNPGNLNFENGTPYEVYKFNVLGFDFEMTVGLKVRLWTLDGKKPLESGLALVKDDLKKVRVRSPEVEAQSNNGEDEKEIQKEYVYTR